MPENYTTFMCPFSASLGVSPSWNPQALYRDILPLPLPNSKIYINPLNAELNPIYYLLALLAHHFLHVSRIRVKSLTLRLLMSYNNNNIIIFINTAIGWLPGGSIYVYGAPILDVSRSHTTTQHSR